jgi:hypothetical protein
MGSGRMFEPCRAHLEPPRRSCVGPHEAWYASTVDDPTVERVGRNEAVFRRVNEEIERVNRAFATITETMELVCECADIRCAERFLMSLPDYERLRSDPALFAVRPGHVVDAVESVVEEHGEYDVIRKHPGRPHEIAEATDPRS